MVFSHLIVDAFGQQPQEVSHSAEEGEPWSKQDKAMIQRRNWMREIRGWYLSWVLFSILVLGSFNPEPYPYKVCSLPLSNIPQSSLFWGDPNHAKIRRKFFICSTSWDHKADSCLLCIANLHTTTLTMALRYVLIHLSWLFQQVGPYLGPGEELTETVCPSL